MATITEDYVSFETAKLLKEKGFNVPCNCYGAYSGVYLTYRLCITNKHTNWNKHTDTLIISCPTLQMAMKWLRKNHQIFIRPNTSFLYPIKWYSEIFCYGDNLKTQQDIKTEYYDSPEEACEAAIKYCLENLI